MGIGLSKRILYYCNGITRKKERKVSGNFFLFFEWFCTLIIGPCLTVKCETHWSHENFNYNSDEIPKYKTASVHDSIMCREWKNSVVVNRVGDVSKYDGLYNCLKKKPIRYKYADKCIRLCLQAILLVFYFYQNMKLFIIHYFNLILSFGWWCTVSLYTCIIHCGYKRSINQWLLCLTKMFTERTSIIFFPRPDKMLSNF